MSKNSEEAINQVLAGLRDSEAPVGMKRRIVQAVQDRAETKSQSRWPWLGPIDILRSPARWGVAHSWTWAWSIALAGTVAICATVFMVRRTESIPNESYLHATAAERPSIPEVAEKTPQLPPPSIVRTGRRAPARKAHLVRVTDAAKLDEMRAISYPAPPAPLTQEEKLLLRIAHKGDPQELALLNPVMRAARDAQEKAAVERFFTPPTTGDNE